jgi:hypothetical protein
MVSFDQAQDRLAHTTKDLARLRRNQIGKKMFTTKDTKITKFGV